MKFLKVNDDDIAFSAGRLVQFEYDDNKGLINIFVDLSEKELRVFNKQSSYRHS